MERLPRYDIAQSYEWNYDHAPHPVAVDVPELPGDWRYAGLRVSSPLGVPAGPLLNGQWCLYYASLGFDVLTYKTVRSVQRACYPLPNLQPVECGPLTGGEENLPVSQTMRGSWAVSFGMPSQAPDVWRRDLESTRSRLPQGKLLSVSVVGSVQEGWSLDDLAKDYAQCARWAFDSGADCVETNFSCPNVATCDGQLYQVPQQARLVAQQVRQAIGQAPYVVKIGHVDTRDQAAELLDALTPQVTALAMTNSVAATVRAGGGSLLFEGQRRGICGAATREASLTQVRMFAELIRERGLDMELVGVGGASTADDVRRYLQAGAGSVHLATAAMTNPMVAAEIKRDLAASGVVRAPVSNPSAARAL